jgi:hypothetical protein
VADVVGVAVGDCVAVANWPGVGGRVGAGPRVIAGGGVGLAGGWSGGLVADAVGVTMGAGKVGISPGASE